MPYGEWRFESINGAPNDPYYDKYADAVLGIPSLLEWYLESSCKPECGTPFTNEIENCNKKLPLWGELIDIHAYSDPVLCNVYRNYKTCDTTETLRDGSVYETRDAYLADIIPIVGRVYASNDEFWNNVFNDPVNGYDGAHQPTIFDIDRHYEEQIRKLNDPETILVNAVCNPECTVTYDVDTFEPNFPCSVQIPDGYKISLQYDEYACKAVKILEKCIKKPPTDEPPTDTILPPEPPKESKSFTPNPQITTDASITDESDSTGAIVGGVVGGIVGVALICTGGWFGYKWYKNRGENDENIEA